MRIIAGKHRGRRIEVPNGRAIRPTADAVREAVFNILAHALVGPEGDSVLAQAVVLDAFCGSGGLGLEALSRGADHALFLDHDRQALAVVRANLASLGEEARAELVRADATRPPRAARPATLAFLDPPYHKGLVPLALTALAAAGWFAPGAVVVVETADDEPPLEIEGFEAETERRYGRTRITILIHTAGPDR